MSKKDFMRGVETAAKANEAFMRRQVAATEELGKRIIQKIDKQGKIVDVILDTLNAQEKKDLYDLQSAYDIADLGENEKEVLASFLLTLISEYKQDSDNQKDYYFAVKKHLGVTDVSPDFDLSLVENVDSRSELKAMLSTVCEFLFLKTGDTSFLDEFEEEISFFGLSRKVILEIVEPIERIYDVLGLRGIVEHYIPAEEEQSQEESEENVPKGVLVLDWKENKEFCLQNGIEINYSNLPTLKAHRKCLIRNFPKIYIDETSVIDCIFENCEDVTISESFVTNCVFKNVDFFYIDNTKIENSRFEDLSCSEGEPSEGTGLGLFMIEDVEIMASVFENVTLENNTYMFDADGRCKISNSEFKNIRTDRIDEKLYRYEITDGKGWFKTTYQCTLIDKNTCFGLDAIIVI